MATIKPIAAPTDVSPANLESGIEAVTVVSSPHRPPELSAAQRALLDQRLNRAHELLARRTVAPATIPRRPPMAEVPLTHAQEGLWFLDRLEPGQPVYNLCQAVRMTGELDRDALGRALNDIVARHESLRANFPDRDGQPVQVIAPTRALPLRTIDVYLADPADETTLQACIREETRQPFNLADDLLIRALLIRVSPRQHVLVLTLHHIISDAWSIGVLFRELAALYPMHAHGRAPSLPELPVQFADYAVWERESLDGPALERLLAFWRAQLAGNVPPVDVPCDLPRSGASTVRGGVESVLLPVELARELTAFGHREGATLFMTLLAAFQCLLHRWTGQDDFVVGSVVAGRRKRELEELIGYFVNTVVFRANVGGNPTFREMLARVRETTLGVMAHQDLPFERLVQELRPNRAAHRNPVFQVLFVLQNASMAPVDFGALHLQPMDIDTGTAKFDLTLSMADEEYGLRAAVEYNADLFTAETIRRLLASFETLLRGLVANPAAAIGALPIVPPDLLRKMLREWNATELAYDRGCCIHEAFERQVRERPDAVAVAWRGERWTYQQLNAAADRLALALRSSGVGPETLVGLFLRRTPQLLVGMLGILKAGGAYVPLDPAYPAERLRLILEDSRAAVVVTEQALARQVPGSGVRTIKVDALTEKSVRRLDAIAEQPKPTPANLAYVIYTSGSTGRPKGVCVLHRGVMALVAWACGLYSAFELSGVLFTTSACFDISVFESLVPLCLGGKIILMENLLQLAAQAPPETITLVSAVPSVMTEVVRQRLLPPSVRTVNMGGEACPQSLVDSIYALGHIERVYDVYGPTETTVYSVGGLRRAGGRPTIGRPLPNEKAFVLDRYGQFVPPGVPGELYLGGEKLARGYFNRPELTAERFVEVPVLPGERLYRTGDIARWWPDGTLEYLGRADRQVKIRGFRVEPGEVEAVLGKYPGVKDCAVVVRDDATRGKALVACVVASQYPAPDAKALHAFLAQRLPEYLVPTTYVTLDALPLTPNGKLDVRALSEVNGFHAEPQRRFIGPRDAIEQKLIAVWEEVIGQHPIGVGDDFFELGGHSLLAVRMIAHIERRLGCKLPVSVLFRASTVEQLARLIRERGLAAPGSSLVEIQPKGEKPPIFWLHTLGGGAGAGLFTYQKIAQHLGARQPSYGFISPGEPPPTFEALAGQYVRELRSFQPEGPYFLGGYCFGGVLAYEMARQLSDAGATIGLVVLLDSFPPNPPGIPGRVSAAFLKHAMATAPAWTLEALKDPVQSVVRSRNAWQRLTRKWRQRTEADAARPAQELGDFVDVAQYPAEFKAHAEKHWAAMVQYHPQPARVPLALFRTRRPRLLNFPAEFQWRRLSDLISVHIVSGTHQNILEGPQALEIAAQLRRLLER